MLQAWDECVNNTCDFEGVLVSEIVILREGSWSEPRGVAAVADAEVLTQVPQEREFERFEMLQTAEEGDVVLVSLLDRNLCAEYSNNHIP